MGSKWHCGDVNELREMRRAVGASACASALVNNGTAPAQPSGENKQQVSGLRYWVPVDVAIVQAKVTTKVTTEIAEGKKEGKPALVPQTTRKVEREGTLSIRTLADQTVPPYILDVAGGTLRDTSIGIDVSSIGLLRSVSPSSTGRAGEFVQSIARFGGTALSLATGLPFFALKLDANRYGRMAKGPLSLPLACDPFNAPFSTMPLRVRAFTADSEEGCALLLEILQREAAMKQHEQDRLELELQLETTEEANLPKLKARIQATKAAIKSTQAELAGRQARFAALLQAWVADKKLGVDTEVAEFATVLQLDELPRSAAELGQFQKANEFFDQTGLLVSTLAVGVRASTPTQEVPTKDKNAVRIHYRQSEPRRFRVEASTEPSPAIASLKLLNESLADVIVPNAPTQFVDFESSAWAQRKLALSFDDRGRPVHLERTGTSAGAAVAVAVSDATRAVRDEYAAGLAKVAEVQATGQKLQLGAVNTQIDELKKKKELLDARLAVEGSTQNFQTLLEQQQLQAEIGLLQARQTQDSVSGSATQRLEIESLKLQLEQLKAQIEILKAQQELEKLTKK